MKAKSLAKEMYALIPLVLSGILCIFLIFFLWEKITKDEDFIGVLEDTSSIFIAISGFLAGIIMVYLAFSAVNLKNTRSVAIDHLSKVTQKMHNFRSIIELLLRSKMWLPGLKEYMDEEFSGLTFFELKEFYKGRSKIAIEFLEEKHPFEETENLYLELKSLLMTHPKEKKLSENIIYPSIYNKEIVTKWLEHKCSSGLWYFFGYKYGEFKSSLDFNSVYERHQDKIMKLANTIDHEAFQDSSFNEIFLAKLGEYMSTEVIPKLVQFQGRTEKKLPSIISYLYLIFLLIVVFGVLLPLAYILLQLSVITLVISFSFTLSILFFITSSFYHFIIKEANS